MLDWQRRLSELPAERADTCLLCGASGEEDPRWRRLLVLPPAFGVLLCRRCGLRWLSPRPSAEGFRFLYSDDAYFGGSGASPADYAALAAGRQHYFLSRIEAVERALPGRATLRILDYGAASGEFVALARARGHDAVGVEFSEDARAAAREKHGLELLAPEQGEQLPAAGFDLVHMNHVLEHLPDPLERLRWCRRVLRPEGLLLIEVPQQFDNDLDRVRRWLRLGGRQPRFDAYSLHHLYFFSPKALRRLLHMAGFSPRRLRTFNPAKTPWRPLAMRNLVLRIGLGAADLLHGGGNIIEVCAEPARSGPGQT